MKSESTPPLNTASARRRRISLGAISGRFGRGDTPRREQKIDANRRFGPSADARDRRLRDRFGAFRIVTPLGWIALAAGVLTLIVGLACSWMELIAVAAVLLLAVLIAIPFALGRTAFEVSVELSPRRVTVGERAHGRLIVRNAADDRSLPVRMELPVGLGRADFRIPPLAPDEAHEELFYVPTTQRAVIPAGPATSVRGDEIGLLRRVVRWTGVLELFVHPQTIALDTNAAGVLRDLEGVEAATVSDLDLAFHALRPYEIGDDRRAIHWRTSARTGQLMVRQFRETRRSQLLLVMTTEARRYSSPEEFELAVSVLASLAKQAILDGVDITVVTEAGRLPTRTVTALLDATCRMEVCAPRHESMRRFVAAATRGTPEPSVAMVIAGSALDRAELRAVQTLWHPDVQTVALVCDDTGAAKKELSGDLVVATLSTLNDLPKVAATL